MMSALPRFSTRLETAIDAPGVQEAGPERLVICRSGAFTVPSSESRHFSSVPCVPLTASCTCNRQVPLPFLPFKAESVEAGVASLGSYQLKMSPEAVAVRLCRVTAVPSGCTSRATSCAGVRWSMPTITLTEVRLIERPTERVLSTCELPSGIEMPEPVLWKRCGR